MGADSCFTQIKFQVFNSVFNYFFILFSNINNWFSKRATRAIYFCSCRAILNILAGLRAKSPKLIIETIKTVFREDPYFINKLRLPFFAFREVWVSLFPKKLPPARETKTSS